MSLGQGQGPKAEFAISEGKQQGAVLSGKHVAVWWLDVSPLHPWEWLGPLRVAEHAKLCKAIASAQGSPRPNSSIQVSGGVRE